MALFGMKRTALKRKSNKLRRLIKLADKLYQEKYIRLKPKSIISGNSTEVIHHFIQKKQSNNLRYNEKNGVPLTNAEHFAHHTKGDPEIVMTIVKRMGGKWYNDLQIARRTICKFNIGYLESIIKELTFNNRIPLLGTNKK